MYRPLNRQLSLRVNGRHIWKELFLATGLDLSAGFLYIYHTSNDDTRLSYNGITSAFQAEETGSTPAGRSIEGRCMNISCDGLCHIITRSI